MLSQVQLVLRYICMFFFSFNQHFYPSPQLLLFLKMRFLFLSQGHHVKDPKPRTNATPYVPPSPQRLLSASYIMQAVKVAGGIQGQMLLR